MVKKQIKERFHRASASYDRVAHIQKKSAHILVDMLRTACPTLKPQTILDVGAGTGYVTQALLTHYPHAHYTLNDIAPNMLHVARNKLVLHDTITFSLGDMEELDFAKSDLVISNLALQWAIDWRTAVQKFAKKASIFAFSCLLEGTFATWQDILRSYNLEDVIKSYPTEEEVKCFCQSFGHPQQVFQTQNFQLHFATPFLFMTYLKSLGTNLGQKPVPFSILRQLQKGDCPLTVTYRVFFVVLGTEDGNSLNL